MITTEGSPSSSPPARPSLDHGGQGLISWLRQMRKSHPVWSDKNGVFHVFRYDDVRSVLLDHTVYSSDIAPALGGQRMPGQGSLMSSDLPEHARLRGLISQGFTPRAVADLESHIVAAARDLLQRVDPEQFEVVGQFAHPLPVSVIAALLGVPASDIALFRSWADQLVEIKVDDPTRTHLGPTAAETMREMGIYVMGHVSRRRRDPSPDLISRLVQAQVAGGGLSDFDVVNSSFLILLAGQMTSTLTIANAVICLAEWPDLPATLRSFPELIPSAVEEIVRFRPPLTHISRRAKQESWLGSTLIPADRLVMTWLLSANRDERQFPDPDRFDVGRNSNKHVGFGQ